MTSLAASLAPHLPYLRRYARALTGSQDSGDAYVIATLETLVEAPHSFPREMPERVGLFHVFSKLWNSIDVNVEARTGGVEGDIAVADKRLESVTPLPRQAFLLSALEGFSHHEAALIIGCSDQDAELLVARAEREIADQVATNVLIIEDEPMIALDLEELVLSLGHSVVGNARTQREAVRLARDRKPGLILADIQLADGSSGLEAVNEILTDFSVPVIFITAFPERLLTGERPEPTFLITKPFQARSVKAIINQALFFERKADQK